jgi:hypothetical protein
VTNETHRTVSKFSKVLSGLPPLWPLSHTRAEAKKATKERLTHKRASNYGATNCHHGNRLRRLALRLWLIHHIWSTKIFVVDWIQRLESSRRRCRGAGKLSHKVNPDIRPRRQPITEMPTATAGLKAQPEMSPTENAPTSTVIRSPTHKTSYSMCPSL